MSSRARSTAETPSPDTIRQELKSILASPAFANAVRSQRFLTYVVEQTLAGQQGSIKELVLGIEVFDRPGDFDPRADPIVRVEAVKLRKRLQEYYEGEGASARLRIDLPKPGYIPDFCASEGARPEGQPDRLSRRIWLYVAALVGLAVASAGVYWLLVTNRQSTTSPGPSVAVLPFLNFSPDPANEYFADGITEDLTDALARTGNLRVVSRTSAFLFKGKQADIQDIGKKLHASYAVEGSVRKDGERVKISAQLVCTDDGYHVWSSSFERDMKDVFAVQRAIAESVTSALESKLAGVPRRLAKPRTTNAEAFDLYLRARHAFGSGFLADYQPVQDLLRKAIAADPSYSPPYVWLADTYMRTENIRPPREVVALAKEQALKALSLDEQLPEAHVLLGNIAARNEYDFEAAERHFQRALGLDPNSALAHHFRAANLLLPQEKWGEVLAEERRALELDPLSPVIGVAQPWLLYEHRQYDAALEAAEKLRGAGPEGDMGYLINLPGPLAAKGDYDGALQAAQKLPSRPLNLATRAILLTNLGRTAEARRILAGLTAESSRHYIPSIAFVFAYLGFGDRDRVFEYLEKARREQEALVVWLRYEPRYDPIRSDPRYLRLLSEIHLTDTDIQRYQSVPSSDNR
jgi:serine/threonine-protein kinase